MCENLLPWCSLWRAQGVGSKTFFALLASFSTPEAFFHASAAEIKEKLPHLSLAKVQKWQSFAESGTPDIAWLKEGEDRHIITWHDSRYPPLLKEIPDPPPLLFLLGNPSLLMNLQLAIVGSRNASNQALSDTYHFAYHLAQAGFSIVSGLAQGIDGAAHQGALMAGGKTLAVVGTGLDRVYPAQHRHLAMEIADKGLLVSEFSIGTPAKAAHFPRRNRIISGLSLGVLVVEASLKSGSLITARMALEQGREVFAIPSSIHNPQAKGCHHLIKQGAKLVENIADIVDELPEIANGVVHLMENAEKIEEIMPVSSTLADQHLKTLPVEIPAPYLPILKVMGTEPCSHDLLVERLKLTSEEISAMLSILEIDGYITSLGGGLFQRSTTIMID